MWCILSECSIRLYGVAIVSGPWSYQHATGSPELVLDLISWYISNDARKHMPSKYYIVCVDNHITFSIILQKIIIKPVCFRSVSTSLSCWLLCLTLIRHFTVFVQYCHQILSKFSMFHFIFFLITYLHYDFIGTTHDIRYFTK